MNMLDRELNKRLSMRPKDYQSHIGSIQGRFRKVDETENTVIVGLFKSLEYKLLDDIHITHIASFYVGDAGDNTSHKTRYLPDYPVKINRSMYSGFIEIEKPERR